MNGVQGPSRLLNHSRFPNGRAHGFAAPLRVALPPSVATAHRADASLRACRGLGQSPGRSIVTAGAGRARRSFRSPPAGRFGPFGAKCPQGTRFPSRHRAHASLRCLRTTQRGGATPKMVAVGRSGNIPQLIRYRPARFKMRMRGLSRASGASQASAARNARNPRASVSSTLEAQETRLASPTGSQGHSPVRPSAAAGAPAPAASSAGRIAPRARKRFECPKDTRNASRHTLPLRHPGAIRPAPPVRGLESRSSPKCIPNPATCAVDSAALRQQGNLTPAAACAEGKRVPCGHLREAQSDPQA